MTLSRRYFLGMGLASAAGGLLPTASFAASIVSLESYANPVYFLPTGSAFDTVFSSGIGRGVCRTDACPIDLNASLLTDWGALVASMQKLQGACLLGIIEEWRYGLFEEGLREVGAAILCKGHHIGDRVARHHFISLPASQGVGETLAQALAAQGAKVLVDEKPLHDPIAVLRPARPANLAHTDWRAMTADMFSQIVSGNWRVAEVRNAGLDSETVAAMANSQDALPTARHVSFAVQL